MGRFEQMAYEVSRSGRPAGEYGPYSQERLDQNKQWMNEMQEMVEYFGVQLALVPDHGRGSSVHYWIVLYKHQWALDAATFLLAGRGAYELSQRHRDWSFGLLFGYGADAIAGFCDKRTEYYKDHESKGNKIV
jgi:hypothetical protein